MNSPMLLLYLTMCSLFFSGLYLFTKKYLFSQSIISSDDHFRQVDLGISPTAAPTYQPLVISRNENFVGLDFNPEGIQNNMLDLHADDKILNNDVQQQVSPKKNDFSIQVTACGPAPSPPASYTGFCSPPAGSRARPPCPRP